MDVPHSARSQISEAEQAVVLNEKKGWLSKRGDVGLSWYLDTVWQNRFFVLCPGDKTLKYYTTEDIDLPPKAFIVLSQVSEMEVKESYITLHTATRIYYMLALNSNIAKEWETALLPYTSDPRNFQGLTRTPGHALYQACKATMDNFIDGYCSYVTPWRVIRYINRGIELILTLKSGPQVANYEDICALMWLFTIRVASYGELFTSGVYRISDNEGVLFQYLNSCEGVYERWSSHYVEHIGETKRLNPGFQRGLDFKMARSPLPASKRTLLFFRLGDGSLVIKMEYNGCPPFWQPNFMSYSNATEFARHTLDYVSTRFVPNKGLPLKRTEHVPDQIIANYKLALSLLYEESSVGPDDDDGQAILLAFGTTFGISAMLNVLEGLLEKQGRAVTDLGSFIVPDLSESELKRASLEESRISLALAKSELQTLSQSQLFTEQQKTHFDVSLSRMDMTLEESFIETTNKVHQLHDAALHCSSILPRATIDITKETCYKKVKDLVDKDRERGYTGERKGMEVCLPDPLLWPEIIDFMITN